MALVIDDMAAAPSPVPAIAIESPGLRGKRKSCSVVVGFMVKNGLVVAVGVVVLAAIVSCRTGNWRFETLAVDVDSLRCLCLRKESEKWRRRGRDSGLWKGPTGDRNRTRRKEAAGC